MASTSSMMLIPERDASLRVLTSIVEKLNDEEQQKLGPYLTEIEQHITKTVEDVPKEQVKRKHREVIFAAAIYDTLLHYQQIALVKVNMKVIVESLGLKQCAVNRAWLSLFDNRVKINHQRLECVRGKSKNPKYLVTEVVTILKNAVVEKTQELDEWFSTLEAEAKDLIDLLEKQALNDNPPDILAVVAVYDIIRKQGKPLVPLSQRHAALLCRSSSAMISRIWLELFDEGSGE